MNSVWHASPAVLLLQVWHYGSGGYCSHTQSQVESHVCLPATDSSHVPEHLPVQSTSVSDCRLFERELDYIVNHAQDEYIILDLTFIDLMVKLQQKLTTVKGFIILTDRQHMPRECKLHNMLCYEDLLEVSSQSCCVFRIPVFEVRLEFSS